jgi:hypothetical protein|tara:strand:- start:496 stop:774 length:279 start_codon:yes stop_codon:yes gene_type:complete
MTKKEYSYVVISVVGDMQEFQGVYRTIEAACYGARFSLSTLFPKHGDEVRIIRCEIISTEEAKSKILEKEESKDIFEKCEDGYCPLPTQQAS